MVTNFTRTLSRQIFFLVGSFFCRYFMLKRISRYWKRILEILYRCLLLITSGVIIQHFKIDSNTFATVATAKFLSHPVTLLPVVYVDLYFTHFFFYYFSHFITIKPPVFSWRFWLSTFFFFEYKLVTKRSYGAYILRVMYALCEPGYFSTCFAQ